MVIYTKGGKVVNGVDGEYRNADYFEKCEITKKVLVEQGYRNIIKAYKDAGVKVDVIGDESDKSMTVADIKEALDAKGIEYPSDAKKAELVELLQE